MTGRYERKDLLGEGGMGYVFRAFDHELKREVAVKTIRDAQDRSVLDLFRKECAVLAALHHPNIVDIYDIGESEEAGAKKPYFVMPLLPGAPLNKLIQTQPHRLTPERTVEIMAQVCRGLQAAHERGLIHRDLKPSNIFVLDDDSVKIIDFGVAHLVDHRSSIGVKGTLFYMAPEQLDMQPASAMTDIFSLGVVAFEMLTRRRPFTGTTQDEIVEAIRKHIPPPASELNPAVNNLLSQVVHAAMAKQPWHRFSSAKEFAESLHKAVNNQPVERFDRSKIESRLQNVRQALEESQYDFAHEILTELEAEGHIHTEMRSLRDQVDRAMRGRQLRQLIESAKTRLDRGEFLLALDKIHQALQIDPAQPEALALRETIQTQKSAQQVDNWLKLGRQHLENNSFAQARQALQSVLQLNPLESSAIRLLSEVDRREQEYAELSRQKEREYTAAMENWRRGEVSAALSKLERVIEIDKRAPTTGSHAEYRDLYNKVRDRHEQIRSALEEIRALVGHEDFDKADALCDKFLAEMPNDAQFRNLKFDIEEKRRQGLSAYIAKIDSEVSAEPDLDKRVLILTEALKKYPDEPHFQRAVQTVSQRRDHINSIVAKARNLEERGQYSDARSQWETLRTVYSQYPGLEFEVDRLRKREEQQSRLDQKAKAVAEIDRAMRSGDFSTALHQVQLAMQDFPDAQDLAPLEKLAKDGLEKEMKAAELLQEGRAKVEAGQGDAGLQVIEEALGLAPQNTMIAASLVQALLKEASRAVDTDWRRAERLVKRALEMDATNQQAKGMRTMVADRKRNEAVDKCLAEARRLQVENRLGEALKVIDEALGSYPGEPQLVQVAEALRDQVEGPQRQQERQEDLRRMEQIESEIRDASDSGRRQSLLEQTSFLANKYPDDASFQAAWEQMRRDWQQASGQTPKPGTAKPTPVASVAPDVTIAQAASAPASAVPASAVPGSAVPASAPSIEPKAAPAPPPPPAAAPKAAEKKPEPPKPAPQKPPAAPAKGRNMIAFAASLLGLVIVLIGIYQIVNKRSGAPKETAQTTAAGQISFQVVTNPPGAKILVDGVEKGTSPLTLSLSEGAKEVEAQLAGHMPLKQQIFVNSGMEPVTLSLVPSGQVLRVSIKAGKVSVDEQDVPLVDGAATVTLTPGEHTIKVADDATGRLTLRLNVGDDPLPSLLEPPKLTGILATIAATQGDKAKVLWPAKVVVNGQEQSAPDANGITLTGLPQAGYQLTVKDSISTRPVMLETGPGRLFQVIVTDHTMGGFTIASNAEGARVLINGKEARQRISGGKWMTYLPAGVYKVKVAAEGFSDEPEQEIEVKKGALATLNFNLKSTPKMAIIELKEVTDNADVYLDNTKMGTTNAQGYFKSESAPPGSHKLILRKEGFDDSAPVAADLVAGRIAGFSGMKVRPFGRVEITRNPASVTVRYRPEAGGEFRAVPANTFPLKEGKYVFEGAIPGAPPKTQTVEVRPGSTVGVGFTFADTKQGGQTKGPSLLTTSSLNGREQGGWMALTGPSILDVGEGSARWTFKRQGGAMGIGMKKVVWYLGYKSERDHWRCEFGEKELDCKNFEGGREIKGKAKRWDFKLDKAEEYNVEIEITGGSAVQRLPVGTFTLQDSDIGEGKFGFRGDVLLKDFQFRRK